VNKSDYTVMSSSQSEVRISLVSRSEHNQQIMEEGNRTGLGFNLCIAPTGTLCGRSYNSRLVIGDWSYTKVRQGSDRGGRKEVGEREGQKRQAN